MRISRFVPIVAGFAVALAVPLLSAQSIFTVGTAAAAQPKLPCTATWTDTFVQTLADGTIITRQITTKFARDASGRTYTETHNSLPIGPDGHQHEVVFYIVQDPVAHTSLSWNSNAKEATLLHQPAPEAAAPRALSAIRTMPLQANTSQAPRPDPNFQHEDLGTKNIDGVNAKGFRITQNIPAGQIGNDQPITVVSESWHSAEYDLIMLSTSSDPRVGKSTREITDFEPGDPDPSLFQAPQGYSVRDVTPHVTAAAAQ